MEVSFHNDVEISQNEEKVIFEEFENLVKKAFLSIGAPFESLKGKDNSDLDNLGLFIKNEEKGGKLNGILSFGDKDKWVDEFEGLFWKLLGRGEVEKENDINVSN